MLYPIDQEFFRSEKVCDVKPEHRLLYIGLNSLACKDGGIKEGITGIRIKLFPGDCIPIDDLRSGIAMLGIAGLLHVPQGIVVNKGNSIRVLDWRL